MILTWTLVLHSIGRHEKSMRKNHEFSIFLSSPTIYKYNNKAMMIPRQEKEISVKALFHKFWMPLKSDTFDTTKLLFD